ncbi:MAG TPA: metallophosphoesterase [Burkholderiaceae bacterium]|nr:metallophosphoesterase [Burkholderiaceae bacterium]
MRLQLLSDLHLESEAFDLQLAPGAEILVLAGDIESGWEGLARFAHWPVPVLFVAGNHEFDNRDLDDAWPTLRERCASFGITMLEREALVLTDSEGRRIRFVSTIRWSDFNLFGPRGRAKAERAAAYFMRLMNATRKGLPFNVRAIREEALACRAWLESSLREPAEGRWDATVVITHFAPSLRSADPRYGTQPATASFCNADDDLLPLAEVWLHGHLHCRHDYRVEDATGHRCRVVSQARGLAGKGEPEGFDPMKLIEV